MSGIDFVMLIMLEDWMTNDILAKKETTVELFLIKGSSLEEMQISTVTGQRGHTDSSLN